VLDGETVAELVGGDGGTEVPATGRRRRAERGGGVGGRGEDDRARREHRQRGRRGEQQPVSRRQGS
jgi:hypothetical protein